MTKKFRAFVNDKLYIQEYCGGFCYFIHGESDALSLEEVFVFAERGKCLLHQWTGLLDKNGREIYEGDILLEKWTAYSENGFGEEYEYPIETKLQVIWDTKHAAWNLADKDGRLQPFIVFHLCSGKSEVVGNIFENPLDKQPIIN